MARRLPGFPPDKGGMRGGLGRAIMFDKSIPALQTPPVLPLSGEGRNGKRSRVMTRRLPGFPPDKGGMRGVLGRAIMLDKSIPARPTPPVLPLSWEERNDKRSRVMSRQLPAVPPDKGGMRGVLGRVIMLDKSIPARPTPPVLPLSGEGRNGKRSRVMSRRLPGCPPDKGGMRGVWGGS
jgi:hypothetical protein